MTQNFTSLSIAEVIVKACLDLFLSGRPERSFNPIAATSEVMLWLGDWGIASRPTGLTQELMASQTVNRVALYVIAVRQRLVGLLTSWVVRYFRRKFIETEGAQHG
jgi:hypothetical protein